MDCVVSLLKKNVAKPKEAQDDEGKPEQKLSKVSIRNVVAVLRAMLNEAVERNLLTVQRQYKGKITRTKTKKIRKVDVSNVLLRELQALKKPRKEEYLSRGKDEIPDWSSSLGEIIWEDGKPVGRKEGHPLDTKNFRNRVFLKATDKAQIRRRRLNDTRHSFASILLMNGEGPAYVKDQLGQASIKRP